MSSIVERLAEPGAFLIGTWSKIPSIETVELMAHAGFDFIAIDMEHAPLTYAAAYQAIALAQGCGLHVLARTPDASGSSAQRLLDAGVDGLLAPRVGTAAQARAAMEAMNFPPLGQRGMGFTSRAGRWGLSTREDYLARGRDHVLRGVQLEDLAALEGVAEIAQAPGLNALFIGFADLALSSGLASSDPRIQALERQVLCTARAAGIPCGTAVQTAAEARQRREDGYAFVLISADTSLFAQAASSLVALTRDALSM